MLLMLLKLMKQKIELNTLLDKCYKEERLGNVSSNRVLQLLVKASILRSHPKGSIIAKLACAIMCIS